MLCTCVRSIPASSKEELASGGMEELERLQEQLARKLLTSLSTSGLSCHCHKGNTPLLCAVSNNDLPAVQLLLGLGVDVNAADHEGKTPLMMAANYPRLGHVEVLLRNGASLDCTSDRGESVFDFLRPNLGSEEWSEEATGILRLLRKHRMLKHAVKEIEESFSSNASG